MSIHTTFLQTPPAYLTNILSLPAWSSYLSFNLMCQHFRLTFRRADGELETKLLSVITGLSCFISPRAQWVFSFSTVLGKTALRNWWQQSCELATHWNCPDAGIDFGLLGYSGKLFCNGSWKMPISVLEFQCKNPRENCVSGRASRGLALNSFSSTSEFTWQPLSGCADWGRLQIQERS